MPCTIVTVTFLLVFPMAADDATPKQAAALSEFKTYLEKGDLKKLGDKVAGESGNTLRRLAEPFSKAKAASDRLDKALADKPEVGWQNPFAAGLAPLARGQLEIVEITPNGESFVARVRYGQFGQEEAVGIRKEGEEWRIDLPAELARALRPLAKPERLEKRRRELEILAEILNSLAADIEAGKRKTKEEVILRLVELISDGNLFPAPESKPGGKPHVSG
jgi:hypothetical protein